MVGRRGPAPEPTKLKVIKGTRTSRVNKAAPEPRQNLPVCPKDMDTVAQGVWERVLREYGATGVITGSDHDVFRGYCEAASRYEHAARLLAESGPLVRGARSGELVKNPLHQIVRDNADLVRLLARELGLSPSARSSLTGLKAHEPDALSAWEQSA